VAKWRRFGFLTEKEHRILMIALQNMRMSCNSTYLLDKKTDHGVKADELATLLEDILERPEVKVVIFSQWVRMHEVIRRRLAARRWPHVLFHGGVFGGDRPALIRRFRDDPQCRLFLSTDAGGLGLNLQHASVVVNMDLPWNPAVLDQRVGRVHRLGQRRPVRVVNFVSQGTIEDGMRNLLAFKRSLFSGVLDGGADRVLLGGSRMKRFMESVEKVSAAIPAPMPAEDAASRAEAAEGLREAKDGEEARADGTEAEAGAAGPAGAGGSLPADGLGDLITAGLSFLDQLGKTLNSGSPGPARAGRTAAPAARSLIGRDAKTGQAYLKLPVPSAEALRKIAEALGALAKAFKP
jgi:superfamily II DNA/RNA helicase